jgi:hypothetical protein
MYQSFRKQTFCDDVLIEVHISHRVGRRTFAGACLAIVFIKDSIVVEFACDESELWSR